MMNIDELSTDAELSWDRDINQEIWSFVTRNATTSVRSRVESCYRHYTKSLLIKNIDPEMASIRLITAEEELAVAVFDIIKRNEENFINCKHITKKFKNHFVKQLFSPAISNMCTIILPFLKNGISIDVNDLANLDISIEPIIDETKISLRLHFKETYIDASPFQFFLNKKNEEINVVDELYKDFEELIENKGYDSIKSFAKQHVDFRNKILYADDAMIFDVGEEVEKVLTSVTQTINEMLWVIALLLSNDDSPIKKWGISAQFLRLYEKILIEAKII